MRTHSPSILLRIFFFFLQQIIVRAGQWSYEAPNDWSTHDPAFAVCSSGREQSPIDITDYVRATSSAAAFTIHYVPINVTHSETVVSSGSALQVQYDTADGSRVVYSGREYRLKQFHLHSPAEHTIDGRKFDMELHLVHADERNQLLVTSILMIATASAGAVDPFMDSLQWAHLRFDGPFAVKTQVSALSALPLHHSYYHYQGSLTTPPCTEGVTWIVMSQIQFVSSRHVQRFQDIFGQTNRPIQQIHDRTIDYFTEQTSSTVVSALATAVLLAAAILLCIAVYMLCRRGRGYRPDSPNGLPRIRSRTDMTSGNTNGSGVNYGMSISLTPSGRLPARKATSDSDDAPLLHDDDADGEADDVQAPINSLPPIASPNANGVVGLRRTTSNDQVSQSTPKAAALLNGASNGNRRALQSI